MKESLIMKIWHHIFGYRYYAIVWNRTGTMDIGVGSIICPTKKEAEHILIGNDSFQLMEVVSFRSREVYKRVTTADGYNTNSVE